MSRGSSTTQTTVVSRRLSVQIPHSSPSAMLKQRVQNATRSFASVIWGSVVANTNTTCAGGSSRVFRRALAASAVSWWTSSTM